MDFGLGQIQTVEFGVGVFDGDEQKYFKVSVDGDVQGALVEMLHTTVRSMQNWDGGPRPYNPAERHASPDYVTMAAADPLAQGVCELRDAANIPVKQDALAEPEKMFAYFARFRDRDGRRLTAMRRATQFKGVLKNRLLTFGTDALRIVHEPIFRLDHDFDYIIDSQAVHILRPTAFEFVHGLQSAIMQSVPANIARLQADVPFVDFSNVLAYASTHSRAARYVASICSGPGCANVSSDALRRQCVNTGVSTSLAAGGTLSVDAGHEIGFLEVLDRRRYEIELVPHQPERYRAASRDQI